jgi:serine/threonine protein kinase
LSTHEYSTKDKRDDEFFKKNTTPHIAAPEVILESDFSEASDWWSFGCLLHELMTGFSAFNGIGPY